MWTRDGPASVGAPKSGTVRFSVDEILPNLDPVPPPEMTALRDSVDRLAPEGFQIWGLPSGAAKTIQTMVEGDYLLLLENVAFRYGGKVVHKISVPLWNLSEHVWGESRFPLIVFLTGKMILYHWDRFVADFDYDPNYDWRKLQGRTNRIADAKVRASRFADESTYLSYLQSDYAE